METGVQNNLISIAFFNQCIFIKKSKIIFGDFNLTSMKMLQTIKSLNHHQIKFLQKNAKQKEKKSLNIATTQKKIPLVLYNI